jgi:uncharacterized protein YuzE
MAQVAIDLEDVDAQYDAENDVVYLSFGPIREADDSEMLPNGIVVRYKDGKPIGFTIVGTEKSE